jgi:hypothetical protein
VAQAASKALPTATVVIFNPNGARGAALGLWNVDEGLWVAALMDQSTSLVVSGAAALTSLYRARQLAQS